MTSVTAACVAPASVSLRLSLSHTRIQRAPPQLGVLERVSRRGPAPCSPIACCHPHVPDPAQGGADATTAEEVAEAFVCVLLALAAARRAAVRA
jgi:hypothetical protein